MNQNESKPTATVESVAAILARRPSVVVTTHVNPDGDALGSALAMLHALDAAGADVRYVQSGPIPGIFAFLPGFDRILHTPDGLEPTPEVLLALDCASADRLGDVAVLIGSGATVVNVDHHVTNTRYGDVDLVDDRSAATGEIVHRLLVAMGAPVDPTVATCLYTAIVTDTGRFGYPVTTAATHETAAALLRAGVKPDDVHGPLFRSYPESFLRLEAALVLGIRTRLGGRVAWSEMTHALCAEAGLAMDDATDMVDVPARLAGVEVAALFRETSRPGETKVSLRSKCGTPVNGIAVAHGGGGHPAAAGCTVCADLAETRDMILAEIEETLRRDA